VGVTANRQSRSLPCPFCVLHTTRTLVPIFLLARALSKQQRPPPRHRSSVIRVLVKTETDLPDSPAASSHSRHRRGLHSSSCIRAGPLVNGFCREPAVPFSVAAEGRLLPS